MGSSYTTWYHASTPMVQWLTSLGVVQGAQMENQTRAKVARQEQRWGRSFASQHVIHGFQETGTTPPIQTVARIQFILDQVGRVVVPTLSVFLDTSTGTNWRMDWIAELRKVAWSDQDLDLLNFCVDLDQLAENFVLIAHSRRARLRLYRFAPKRRLRGKLINLSRSPAYAIHAANLLQAARNRMDAEAARRTPQGQPPTPEPIVT